MKKEIIQAVTEQFINMLYNDVIEDNGTEPFVGWCADGEVYADKGLSEEDIEQCMVLSKMLGDLTDGFIYEHLNPQYPY